MPNVRAARPEKLRDARLVMSAQCPRHHAALCVMCYVPRIGIGDVRAVSAHVRAEFSQGAVFSNAFSRIIIACPAALPAHFNCFVASASTWAVLHPQLAFASLLFCICIASTRMKKRLAFLAVQNPHESKENSKSRQKNKT